MRNRLTYQDATFDDISSDRALIFAISYSAMMSITNRVSNTMDGGNLDDRPPIVEVKDSTGKTCAVFNPDDELTEKGAFVHGKTLSLTYVKPTVLTGARFAAFIAAGKWNDPLETALQNELEKYCKAVEGGACPTATLAAQLREIGEHGAALATSLEVNETAQSNPFLVWFNPDRPGLASYPSMLAEALWVDRIQPLMERAAKNERNPAALTFGARDILSAIMWNDDARVVTNDRQAELFVNNQLTATAHLRDLALVDVLTKATPALRSYAAAQFIVWLLDEVKRRHFLGIQYPNVITIEGGLGAAADAAGINASKVRDTMLRQILTAGQAWNVAWANGREVHGLWTFDVRPAAPGRSAMVTITVASALTPNNGTGGILTPIVTVNDLDGITAARYKGRLAGFKQGIVKAIVDQRLDLPKYGGALITDSALATLGRMTGVPKTVIPRAMEAWLVDRDEGPAFLEVNRGRFHIANNAEYGTVRAFIDESASIATTASKRGKRGAAKRAKKEGKK